MTLLGPEWNALPPVKLSNGSTYDERQYLRDAYAEMFVAYGWSSVPPWAGAVAATGSYALARLRMPETKKKIEGWLPKVRDGLKKFFKKKEAPSTPPPAPNATPVPAVS